ncbi:MAG TPA: hypothetical protein QGE98_09650, partial [Alphaproteobacteria bacterium]|nr:hypothetical protein [Alphaproteobacteria bacterium]
GIAGFQADTSVVARLRLRLRLRLGHIDQRQRVGIANIDSFAGNDSNLARLVEISSSQTIRTRSRLTSSFVFSRNRILASSTSAANLRCRASSRLMMLTSVPIVRSFKYPT